MKRGVVLVLFQMLVCLAYSQNRDLSRDTVITLIEESPSFTIFRDNYFITGVPLNGEINEHTADAKFQISFKQRLMNRPILLKFYPYITYTQKSFWNVYDYSRPFAESNYNPAVYFARPIFRKGYYQGMINIGIEHESNGMDEHNDTRSWNFLSAKYTHVFNEKMRGALNVWLPIEISENPDLLEYIGIGELSFSRVLVENRLYTDISVRKAFSWDWRGSYKLNVEYRPFKKGNQYIMLQWFNGYAEGLTDYNRPVNMIRLGFAFKPSFYRFF